MDNKSDEKFAIMQDAIKSNKQDIKPNKQNSSGKMMKLTKKFKTINASSITSIPDQINALKYSPT